MEGSRRQAAPEEEPMAVAHDPVAALKTLGDPEELWQRKVRSPGRIKVNAHIHIPPNFSAFQSVDEVLRRATAEGIGVVGVNNYYDFGVYEAFADLARSANVFPLFGLEVICLIDDLALAGVKINDPGNPGKMYLCGKGISRFSPMSGTAVGLLETIRRSDSTRLAAVIDKLAGLFAAHGMETGVSEESIKAAVVQRYGVPYSSVFLQERHVAQAFQEAVFERIAPERRAGVLGVVLGVDLGGRAN